MLFAILTVVTLAGLAYLTTHRRYEALAAAPAREGQAPPPKDGYFAWLRRWIRDAVKPDGPRRLWKWFMDWTSRYYPGWMKWVFAVMILCFLYLAASGFFFGVFIPRGMFGFPLVLHVSLGGVFAFCLAFAVFWRARDYAFDKKENEADASERFACPICKNPSKMLVAKILFWTNALAGLVIILSALFSMLPIFPAATQSPLLELHRYAALVSALAMIVFSDVRLFPAKTK
ncbi:MAG: cytochrome b/b6 domain-containing protein [Acidobacteriota bacterium]|nr:cytochrome b/b6 domain-containing protein [Acidobacteriota bacterium]